MDYEQRIKDAGADVAPRVAPSDIEANIRSEHYFTAAEGVAYSLDNEPDYEIPGSLGLLTFCVLVLKNGFTVTGESACASPENFKADLGREFARRDAISKVGRLLGFRLRDRLCAEAHAAELESLGPLV